MRVMIAILGGQAFQFVSSPPFVTNTETRSVANKTVVFSTCTICSFLFVVKYSLPFREIIILLIYKDNSTFILLTCTYNYNHHILQIPNYNCRLLGTKIHHISCAKYDTSIEISPVFHYYKLV